jgi:hypothetical protein
MAHCNGGSDAHMQLQRFEGVTSFLLAALMLIAIIGRSSCCPFVTASTFIFSLALSGTAGFGSLHFTDPSYLTCALHLPSLREALHMLAYYNLCLLILLTFLHLATILCSKIFSPAALHSISCLLLTLSLHLLSSLPAAADPSLFLWAQI